MNIYVVQPGDTIESIAERFGISPERIIQDNELTTPENLVEGQTIVILQPNRTYTVMEGDTLESIAATQGVSLMQLLQNNPDLGDRDVLYPGETLYIDYDTEKVREIAINAYAYPFIDRTVLRKTLPYLTYLTLFTYGFTPEGNLIPIDDEEIIQMAREYNVAPMMLLSTFTEEGTFSNQLAHEIFANQEAQDVLIQNIINNMREKGYYGLDVDFEYILPEDRESYVAFITNLRERLNAEGFMVMVALAPKTSSDQPGLLYEAHDYQALGEAADEALIMTYEWGFTYGPPMAVAPLDKVRDVVEYAITEIPTDKILMGVPNYGYDWKLPFVRGESQAQSLGNVAAVEQAVQYGVPIQYDAVSQAPNYNYRETITGTPAEHVVWFEDARSIDAKMDLVTEYGLQGIGIWQIMRYFPQMWLVINSQYDIEKVLE